MKRLLVTALMAVFSLTACTSDYVVQVDEPAQAAAPQYKPLGLWGCPTVAGTKALAAAVSTGERALVDYVFDDNKCVLFPFPVPVEPVAYVAETHNGTDAVYIWEMRFPEAGVDSVTFYTYAPLKIHERLSASIK